VIAAGDPGQLPPVNEAPFFTTVDVTLRQIRRQAWESPIIRQAMEVRAGRPYRSDGADFQVIGDFGEAELRWADVVLCWKNATRRRLNSICRRLAGHQAPRPEAGEPLLCLRNAPAYGVFNGGVYTLAADFPPGERMIRLIVDGRIVAIPNVIFAGQRPGFDDFTNEAITELDYGYALTVHKAQGSEWRRVLLVDEYQRPDHRREWVYTGITRAARSILVVPS
jgi:exodeoxyribonuclease-5